MSIFSTKRIVALGATLVVAGAALTGCSSGGSSSSSNSNCTPKHKDVKTIADGKLTVGVIDIPPFSSYNSGDPKGIDVDIAKKVAKDECLTPVWQQASYANAVQSISGGQIDLAIGTIDRTAARQKAVDFSSSTYLDGLGIASKKGAATIKDLESVGTVGTVDGYLWVQDLRKILGDKLKTYPSSVQLKADFDAGRIDADVDAYGVLVPMFKDSSDVKVELANSKPDERVKAIVEAPQAAFPLTKDNESLKKAVSEDIDKMRKDGDIKKWLKEAGLSEDLAGKESDLEKEYSVK